MHCSLLLALAILISPFPLLVSSLAICPQSGQIALSPAVNCIYPMILWYCYSKQLREECCPLSQPSCLPRIYTQSKDGALECLSPKVVIFTVRIWKWLYNEKRVYNQLWQPREIFILSCSNSSLAIFVVLLWLLADSFVKRAVITMRT